MHSCLISCHRLDVSCDMTQRKKKITIQVRGGGEEECRKQVHLLSGKTAQKISEILIITCCQVPIMHESWPHHQIISHTHKRGDAYIHILNVRQYCIYITWVKSSVCYWEIDILSNLYKQCCKTNNFFCVGFLVITVIFHKLRRCQNEFRIIKFLSFPLFISVCKSLDKQQRQNG